MTEKEARKKWCPVVRISEVSGGFTNHCIASDCMMWRKTGEIGMLPNGQLVKPNGQFVKIDDYGDVTWVQQGYCSLACTPPTNSV